jgi:glutathione synthase/RimK-type ligase-like ATP-grasp enzyme
MFNMKKLFVLTDYNGRFGSKWDAIPYNSGFDKISLLKYFSEGDFQLEYVEMSKAVNLNCIENSLFLYTSSEDVGYHYKAYIEDVVLFLQESGGKMIPNYNYLRANNNKSFMELLRKKLGSKWGDQLKSWSFGTLEEMKTSLTEFNYPIVIKTAAGAMSRGVSLANNEAELIKKAKAISRTKHIFQDIKDYLRPYKHKGYKTNSLYRNKFIIQSFIPNLKNDWKILIYGDKYFVLTRGVAKNDFRASGSHTNYLAGSKALLPIGLLDYAKKVFDAMNTPQLSIDIVNDGNNFHLIEFQAIYFGTSTINMSDVYFVKKTEKWTPVKITESIEQIYAESVKQYLNRV